MLLVTDVGNTHITCGIFDKDQIKMTFRLTTRQQRTSDEYGMFFCDIIKDNKFDISLIDSVIISSVVPDIMHSLAGSFIKYFDITPIIVGPGIKTGIKVMTDNPKEVGADRIVDIVAAYTLVGGPTLVIDFGTATTFDLVTENGEFSYGVTAPGLEIATRALVSDAAKLPEIEIVKPKTILAKDTVTSMQAGIVYGYIGQVEYIISKMKEESGLDNMKVIATGGLGKIIANETNLIDSYLPDLTLQGLRILYEKNKK